MGRESLLKRLIAEKSRRTVALTAVLWTLLVIISLFVTLHNYERSVNLLALDRARAFFEIVVTTRLWNARHGGVYVPVTAETQPNPYLEHPRRDIETTDGQMLTMINPAFMTRQLSEIASEKDRVAFHITSLKPLRPSNKPDEWEALALREFEDKGTEEKLELVEGGKYFRYMAPLIARKPCLDCHAKQGYEVGDVRGGISVKLPAMTILEVEGGERKNALLFHLLILALGLGAVFLYHKYAERSDERIQSLASEIERSNEELSQFAYVASHDLQEPLRMVSSYVSLLSRRYKGQLDENADTFIHYAVDGTQRMQTLINDLLAYSRVGTKGKQFAPVDLNAIFDEMADNLEVRITETGARVTRDELPKGIRGDDVQLRQLFQNLMENAIKFRGEEPPRIHVSAKRSGPYWIISVSDNGIGIEPDYFDRIFVIFQRLHTREEYEGTGIGLALCKKIVERHGGSIRVESRYGEGTTFFFSLPAA